MFKKASAEVNTQFGLDLAVAHNIKLAADEVCTALDLITLT